MNYAYNPSISIHKYLPEKKLACDWHKTIPSPVGRSSQGRAGQCQPLCPPATPRLMANCWRTGASTASAQDIISALEPPLPHARTSLTPIPNLKSQQLARQVQATLALQPQSLDRGWNKAIFCWVPRPQTHQRLQRQLQKAERRWRWSPEIPNSDSQH